MTSTSVEAMIADGRKCRRCKLILQEVGTLRYPDLCRRCDEIVYNYDQSRGVSVPEDRFVHGDFYNDQPDLLVWEQHGAWIRRTGSAVGVDFQETIYLFDWKRLALTSTRYWAAGGYGRNG